MDKEPIDDHFPTDITSEIDTFISINEGSLNLILFNNANSEINPENIVTA